MPANVITTGVQIGQSGTSANNFTVRTLDDGSLRISRGNAGAETSDVLVIDSNGNFSTAPVLGLGQTWQDVTGSRAANTTYTNSTGKPIAVCGITTGASGFSFAINGAVVVTASHSAGNFNCATIIVPAGATYSMTAGSVFTKWSELR